MRGPSIAHIVLVIAMLATVPLLTTSNAVLNFLIVALLIANKEYTFPCLLPKGP